jgi:hypothetical protein
MWIAGLERLCADDESRREWLWLRAQEKDDQKSIRILERADPGLRGRMADVREEVESLRLPRLRRRAYGRLQDELMAIYTGEQDDG